VIEPATPGGIRTTILLDNGGNVVRKHRMKGIILNGQVALGADQAWI
jgi:hypothetical protein